MFLGANTTACEWKATTQVTLTEPNTVYSFCILLVFHILLGVSIIVSQVVPEEIPKVVSKVTSKVVDDLSMDEFQSDIMTCHKIETTTRKNKFSQTKEIQWRIQDFPDEGRRPLSLGQKKYYLARFLPQTAWKWKKLDRDGECIPSQWRIQDFPEEGAPTPRGGANIQFCQIFPKTARNWKNLDPRGRASLAPPLDPPLLDDSFQSWNS